MTHFLLWFLVAVFAVGVVSVFVVVISVLRMHPLVLCLCYLVYLVQPIVFVFVLLRESTNAAKMRVCVNFNSLVVNASIDVPVFLARVCFSTPAQAPP